MGIRSYFDKLLTKIVFYLEVGVSFILGDFAFIIVPLGIIIFIRFLRGAAFKDILLLPEWTFATVIILGLAIAKAVKLKSTIQKDIAFRIDFLLKTFIFLLIIAVIFLVIIVLNQEGIKTNEELLLVSQFILFFLGILSLNIIHFIQKLKDYQKESLPAEIGLGKYYEIVRESLLNIRNNLIYVSFALENKERFKDVHRDDLLHSEEEKRHKKEEIKYLLDSIENSLNSTKKLFEGKF